MLCSDAYALAESSTVAWAPGPWLHVHPLQPTGQGPVPRQSPDFSGSQAPAWEPRSWKLCFGRSEAELPKVRVPKQELGNEDNE